MTITTLHGDCIEILPTLAPGSVQCIVTSPPYFGLRDYGIAPTAWPSIDYAPMPGVPPITIPAQTVCLGLEADPLSYAAHLLHVFRLARPALADTGVAWLNLGDCYAGSWGNYGGQNRGNGSQREIVNGSQIKNKAHKGTESMRPPGTNKIEGIKPKDLILIPARVALALQADGWYVRNQAIWWKPNAMPESVTDRLTNDYEPLYLLAKSPRYYFDQAAIAVPAIATTNRGGNKKAQHLVESPGAYGDGFKERWQPKETRNKRCVWEIATEALRDEHYAPMPEALVEPCILASTLAMGAYEPDDIIQTPTGTGKRETDPSRETGRAGFNRPRRDSEGTRPMSRREQMAYAEQLRASPYRERMNEQAGSAFDHYIRTDRSGARPVPPALLSEWIDLGWLTTVNIPPQIASESRSMVLDMFFGSGTVGRVALKYGRRCIGIDKNDSYISMSERRTDGVQVHMEALL